MTKKISLCTSGTPVVFFHKTVGENGHVFKPQSGAIVVGQEPAMHQTVVAYGHMETAVGVNTVVVEAPRLASCTSGQRFFMFDEKPVVYTYVGMAFFVLYHVTNAEGADLYLFGNTPIIPLS